MARRAPNYNRRFGKIYRSDVTGDGPSRTLSRHGTDASLVANSVVSSFTVDTVAAASAVSVSNLDSASVSRKATSKTRAPSVGPRAASSVNADLGPVDLDMDDLDDAELSRRNEAMRKEKYKQLAQACHGFSDPKLREL